jgi:hypothetical protein
MALVHKQLGDFDKALRILEDIVKNKDSRDHMALNNLANIYQEQDKNEQAALTYL